MIVGCQCDQIAPSLPGTLVSAYVFIIYPTTEEQHPKLYVGYEDNGYF